MVSVFPLRAGVRGVSESGASFRLASSTNHDTSFQRGAVVSMSGSIKRIKVCFAASSGGHLEQLLMLKPLMLRYDSFILTEKTTYMSNLPVRVHYVKQVNRHEASFVPRMFANSLISLKDYLQERPDVVVCTGVLATIPMCLIAKAFGSTLVYIESFAKTSSPTETGKLLHRYADRFYVQWPSMLEVYPDAVCVGGVY